METSYLSEKVKKQMEINENEFNWVKGEKKGIKWNLVTTGEKLSRKPYRNINESLAQTVY